MSDSRNYENSSQILERQRRRSNRWRWVRRALAAVGVAAFLSQTPQVQQVMGGVENALTNTDTFKPPATDLHAGGIVDINFVSGADGAVFPNLRANPEIDSNPPNIIQAQDIEKIGEQEVSLKPGETLTINDYTTVKAGLDPDNGVAPGLWGVLNITKTDGTNEPAYYSLSASTSELIQVRNGGVDLPVTQGDENANRVSVKITQQ